MGEAPTPAGEAPTPVGEAPTETPGCDCNCTNTGELDQNHFEFERKLYYMWLPMVATGVHAYKNLATIVTTVQNCWAMSSIRKDRLQYS